MTGEEGLPQSNALAEATGDSLSELLGRDPETYTAEDRKAIISALREQRKRWEAAEATPKAVKAKPLSGKAASLISSHSASDLGL